MSETVTVLGAGTMGRGIAQVAAVTGHRAVLFDVSVPVLEEAKRGVTSFVAKGIEKGKLPAEAAARLEENLDYATTLGEAVRGASVVIEAVPEDLELKTRVFREVTENVSDRCILASNTSSLSIGSLAAQLRHPERVIGMHFFNPVPIMKLVEIIRSTQTADEVLDRTVSLTRALGKEPIVVKDSPGFATSRLGVALGLEAIRMLEDGVASAEDIDRAMELGYRHPMGPLRLTDLVGLDVRLAIAEHLEREIGPQFRPPDLLRRMVQEGRIGRKVGRGFYEYGE